MLKLFRAMLSGLATVAALAIQPAGAETILLKADLKAASEVPLTTSQGTGTVSATYNTVSKMLS